MELHYKSSAFPGKKEVANMSQLVSIVIPTYSRNDTLIRAISSALNQTHTNIEILVIDDNPVDSKWRESTALLMEAYKEDSKIRYIQHEKNLGGSGARNTGILEARGEYIAFLDDDDEYLPTNVEKKLQVFLESNHEKLALVYGYCEYVDKGKVVYTEKKYFHGNCIFDAIERNCIAATSQWMIKKEAAIEAGFFPIVPSKQDSQMMLRLLGKGYEIQCVPEVLSRYYMDFETTQHISNNGRKPINGEKLYYEECKKYYSLFDEEQIKKIEYSFAKQFYEKWKKIGEIEEANLQKKRMYSLYFFKALCYFTYNTLRSIKAWIKNL